MGAGKGAVLRLGFDDLTRDIKHDAGYALLALVHAASVSF